MSVRDDLERWTFLPADTLPVGGRQISDHARELIAGAVVTRNAPAWVGNRKADAWLLAADGSAACPMVWSQEGELVATVVIARDHVATVPGDWFDELGDEPKPFPGRNVYLSDHARARWSERASTADLTRALRTARVSRSAPAWAWEKDADAVAWLLIGDDITAPLVRNRAGSSGLVAVTFIHREEAECAS